MSAALASCTDLFPSNCYTLYASVFSYFFFLFLQCSHPPPTKKLVLRLFTAVLYTLACFQNFLFCFQSLRIFCSVFRVSEFSHLPIDRRRHSQPPPIPSHISHACIPPPSGAHTCAPPFPSFVRCVFPSPGTQSDCAPSFAQAGPAVALECESCRNSVT
jgi:hypothetical protein